MTIESPKVTRIAVNRWAVAVTLLALPLLAASSGMTALGVKVFFVAGMVSLVPLFSMGRSGWSTVGKSASSAAFLALVVATVIAFAFHPSSEGVLFGVFVVSALGLALSVASWSVDEVRTFVARPFLVVTSVQFLLIVVQTISRSTVGATILHPDVTVQVTNGGVIRPPGMYLHVYIAATFALLCLAIGLAVNPRRGRPNVLWLMGLACASATVAVTHSRSALIGFVVVTAIAGFLAIRRVPHLRVAMIVVISAFAIGAFLTADGWVARFDDSVQGDLDTASLGRLTLVEGAISLARTSPVVGVGPGLYLEALEAQNLLDEEFPFAVHSVPLLAAVELGIPAAIALAGLFVFAGLQAWRSGGAASLVFWSIVPASIFDIVLYDRVNGLLLLGVWSGVCSALFIQSDRAVKCATNVGMEELT